MTEKTAERPSVTLPGTVEKIIESPLCLAKTQRSPRCHPCNMLQTTLYVSDFIVF
jgi:hypothetical protein